MSEEHIFLCQDTWEKAVKARNNGQCVECGTQEDVHVHLVVPLEQGGRYTISNGVIRCLSCSLKRIPVNTYSEDSQSNYDQLPHEWMKKYHRARYKGKAFWEQQLACFITKRKRALSPIVEWYAEAFLRDIPEDVLICTLIELCPSPHIIEAFPSRRYTSTNEIFPPPPLIWNGKQQSEEM